ncbi:MAG TPA: phosphotransferase, partial [Streptosporangiaceae bacterium]
AVVVRALRALAAALTPCPVPDLPAAAESFANDFAGWRRIKVDPPGTLDPWAAARLELLCELADGGLAALVGDTVVHNDIRADNLLIRPDGTVVVVDWPWASRGPAWLDTLLLAANVRLHGGHDADALLDAHTTAGSAQLTAVIAGLAGYFTDVARRPPQPGMPTVRALQRDYARTLLPWLRTRLAA